MAMFVCLPYESLWMPWPLLYACPILGVYLLINILFIYHMAASTHSRPPKVYLLIHDNLIQFTYFRILKNHFAGSAEVTKMPIPITAASVTNVSSTWIITVFGSIDVWELEIIASSFNFSPSSRFLASSTVPWDSQPSTTPAGM